MIADAIDAAITVGWALLVWVVLTAVFATAALYAAVGFAVVGVASAAVDWLWPQGPQEQAHAGAGGPEAPSQDSRDAGPLPDPSQRRTEPRSDRSTP